MHWCCLDPPIRHRRLGRVVEGTWLRHRHGRERSSAVWLGSHARPGDMRGSKPTVRLRHGGRGGAALEYLGGAGRAGLAAPASLAFFFSAVALMAWAAWSLVTYEIGVRILPDTNTRADVGELLRTIGFATAPGILRIFGLVPGLGVAVFVISAVWMLAAMIVAVRQALDFTSTRRAVAVCGLGWLFAIGFAVLFGVFFGPRVY